MVEFYQTIRDVAAAQVNRQLILVTWPKLNDPCIYLEYFCNTCTIGSLGIEVGCRWLPIVDRKFRVVGEGEKGKNWYWWKISQGGWAQNTMSNSNFYWIKVVCYLSTEYEYNKWSDDKSVRSINPTNSSTEALVRKIIHYLELEHIRVHTEKAYRSDVEQSLPCLLKSM